MKALSLIILLTTVTLFSNSGWGGEEEVSAARGSKAAEIEAKQKSESELRARCNKLSDDFIKAKADYTSACNSAFGVSKCSENGNEVKVISLCSEGKKSNSNNFTSSFDPISSLLNFNESCAKVGKYTTSKWDEEYKRYDDKKSKLEKEIKDAKEKINKAIADGKKDQAKIAKELQELKAKTEKEKMELQEQASRAEMEATKAIREKEKSILQKQLAKSLVESQAQRDQEFFFKRIELLAKKMKLTCYMQVKKDLQKNPMTSGGGSLGGDTNSELMRNCIQEKILEREAAVSEFNSKTEKTDSELKSLASEIVAEQTDLKSIQKMTREAKARNETQSQNLAKQSAEQEKILNQQATDASDATQKEQQRLLTDQQSDYMTLNNDVTRKLDELLGAQPLGDGSKTARDADEALSRMNDTYNIGKNDSNCKKQFDFTLKDLTTDTNFKTKLEEPEGGQ